MAKASHFRIERLDEHRHRIRRTGRMNVDGLIYASHRLMRAAEGGGSLAQVANVASLPGIVGASLAMPDFHQGYGFPIGGVAAFDVDKGVVSPGGVGYDINCGVRLLRTKLTRADGTDRITELVEALFRAIPAGVGSSRPDLKLDGRELDRVLADGVGWAVSRGLASRADRERIESSGCIQGADPDRVSRRAKERGRSQLGTLGSGNHFVEIGWVTEVFDEATAAGFGLAQDQLTIMIHTGSRGLGHQVCDDAIKVMGRAAQRHGIWLPDRQLCCAPVDSDEGRAYLAGMAAAANYAFTNRQVISHWVRETCERIFGCSTSELGLSVVYDVAHNMAKLEEHSVDEQTRKLCVHRKGATRAFGPGNPDLPNAYQGLGQPVLIPGDMGRCSHVLVGTEQAMAETFGSTCHGAGRLLSRHQAKKRARGRSVAAELKQQGVTVRCASRGTLAEEIPEAYKDVDEVVEVVHAAGIARKVVRLKPMGVIKG